MANGEGPMQAMSPSKPRQQALDASIAQALLVEFALVEGCFGLVFVH